MLQKKLSSWILYIFFINFLKQTWAIGSPIFSVLCHSFVTLLPVSFSICHVLFLLLQPKCAIGKGAGPSHLSYCSFIHSEILLSALHVPFILAGDRLVRKTDKAPDLMDLNTNWEDINSVNSAKNTIEYLWGAKYYSRWYGIQWWTNRKS